MNETDFEKARDWFGVATEECGIIHKIRDSTIQWPDHLFKIKEYGVLQPEGRNLLKPIRL